MPWHAMPWARCRGCAVLLACGAVSVPGPSVQAGDPPTRGDKDPPRRPPPRCRVVASLRGRTPRLGALPIPHRSAGSMGRAPVARGGNRVAPRSPRPLLPRSPEISSDSPSTSLRQTPQPTSASPAPNSKKGEKNPPPAPPRLPSGARPRPPAPSHLRGLRCRPADKAVRPLPSAAPRGRVLPGREVSGGAGGRQLSGVPTPPKGGRN